MGSDLVAELERRGFAVQAPPRSEVDLGNLEHIAGLAQREVDWVINCAAYTAVDRAQSEPDEAALLNTLAPRYLAMTCALAGFRLLHLSTDYVFDGVSHEPYKEDDPTIPVQVYGLTKRDGEEAVLSALPNALVVRTSWLFGVHGSCFPRSILKAWRSGKPLRVVADQVGCPTYTPDLARVLGDLIERNPAGGIWHAAGPDAVSWHAFAEEVLASAAGHEVPIEAIRTEDWPTAAVRPKHSVLACERLAAAGIEPMRYLKEAVADFIARVAAIESRTS